MIFSMGRASGKGRGRGSLVGQRAPSSDPLEETRRANDYLDLETYVDYGILREALLTDFSGGSQHTREDLEAALEVASEIEKVVRHNRYAKPDEKKKIYEANLSEKGLLAAEGILTECGENAYEAGAVSEFSEQLDPDGSFMSQSDSDHFFALAAYMAALREGGGIEGRGEGIGEARYEYYADIVDAARTAAKEGF